MDRESLKPEMLLRGDTFKKTPMTLGSGSPLTSFNEFFSRYWGGPYS